MIFVSYCSLGVFAVDATGKELGRVLFDREKAAESMRACGKDAVSESEK